MALLVALGAVKHGDFRAKASAEAVGCLGSEGDLGDEHDGRLVGFEGFLDDVQIDFRFPAAGDAVQKESGELIALLQNFFHGGLLVFR